MNYAVLGIAMALVTLGAVEVYADNGMVDYPKISADNMIGQHVGVNYFDDNKWTVTVTTQFQAFSEFDVPNIIYYTDIEGQVHSINIKEGFVLHNSTPQVEEDKIPTPTPQDVIEKRVEEKKLAKEKIIDELWGDYATCLVQFEEEQPVRFHAWKRTAELTEFEVPDKSIAWYEQNYSTEELKAEKAWQVCETLKKYPWVGIQEANKSIDEPLGFELDDSDSPNTVDVTENALKIEADKAEAFKCSVLGIQRNMCGEESTAVNRGNPFIYDLRNLPSWYGIYLGQKETSPDLSAALGESLERMCTEYYPLYEHKVGTENQFPQWLEHCIVEDNND